MAATGSGVFIAFPLSGVSNEDPAVVSFHMLSSDLAESCLDEAVAGSQVALQNDSAQQWNRQGPHGCRGTRLKDMHPQAAAPERIVDSYVDLGIFSDSIIANHGSYDTFQVKYENRRIWGLNPCRKPPCMILKSDRSWRKGAGTDVRIIGKAEQLFHVIWHGPAQAISIAF
jgi:hypothetical protein